ncbi:MAG TPA: peptidase, partial [Gemmatimonadales bacterium]|nr:peptidase [Gemmatimonadales bacterium]
GGDPARARSSRDGSVSLKHFALLRDPALRDPRGYIVPAHQPDFPTATKFINALIRNGITVLRATRDFEVAGKRYPAGSYVVKTAQAFRPHILDMFEPQHHPNDFQYPGGPPIPPYDNAGWTLAYQMGVQFDRILDGFEGPFTTVEGPATPPPGTVARAEGAAGFLLSHQSNDAVIATNRLLAKQQAVHWLARSLEANGKTYPAGTIYIPANVVTVPLVQQLAVELGLSFDAVVRAPGGGVLRARPVRVGLWDRYGGSMPSGWTRWLLERFEFPFEVVFPPGLDGGKLVERFDVLVFPDGAIPDSDRVGPSTVAGAPPAPDPARIPAEYHSRLGRVTVAATVPLLRQFLSDGGTIIAIGSSTSMGRHAGLPVSSHLVQDGKPLPRSRFYVPGSVLRARVDTTRPVAWGVPEQVDLFFDESPVFALASEAGRLGVRPVAWFDNDRPLRSGWAWGQEYLKDGVAVVEAAVGDKGGKLYLFGPEILQRGQPHATFKFFFNAIHLAGAVAAEQVETGSN